MTASSSEAAGWDYFIEFAAYTGIAGLARRWASVVFFVLCAHCARLGGNVSGTVP